MENNEAKVIRPFTEATEEEIKALQIASNDLMEIEKKKIAGDTDIKPLIKETNNDPNDPENKHYLLLAVFLDDEEEDYWWNVFSGRSSVYGYIKDNIECLDVDKSMILVDNVKLQDRVSVYKFMTYIANMKFYDDDFDVEQYHHEDPIEDENNNSSTVETGEAYVTSTYMPISDSTEEVDSVDLS